MSLKRQQVDHEPTASDDVAFAHQVYTAPGLGVFEPKPQNRIERLTAFAASRDRTLLDLAFAWLLAQPTMASVIAGATKPEQVRANANAVSRQLTGDELGEVQEVLSGT